MSKTFQIIKEYEKIQKDEGQLKQDAESPERIESGLVAIRQLEGDESEMIR